MQRPLWASTGVKNPQYSDTMYVTELVAPNTVNTMPEKTLEAVADHGVITGDTVTGTADAAQEVFDKLEAVGHRPDRRVHRARGRGRGEIRSVLARPARGHPGPARHRDQVTIVNERWPAELVWPLFRMFGEVEDMASQTVAHCAMGLTAMDASGSQRAAHRTGRRTCIQDVGARVDAAPRPAVTGAAGSGVRTALSHRRSPRWTTHDVCLSINRL